jgi:hypothetical protein
MTYAKRYTLGLACLSTGSGRDSMTIPLPRFDVLNSISIPTPCTAVPWEDMQGKDRSRFWSKCSEHVYDISELTKADAVALLAESDRSPCLRIYRRPDGRVMTSDCLSRRQRTHRWLRKQSAWAAWFFALVFLGGCVQKTMGVIVPDFEQARSCLKESDAAKKADDNSLGANTKADTPTAPLNPQNASQR